MFSHAYNRVGSTKALNAFGLVSSHLALTHVQAALAFADLVVTLLSVCTALDTVHPRLVYGSTACSF